MNHVWLKMGDNSLLKKHNIFWHLYVGHTNCLEGDIHMPVPYRVVGWAMV
jgi:hypothetical protein